MISVPISEFHDRKAVYLFTLPAFLLFTMGTGISQNIAFLLVCRSFAASFGTPALAISAGTFGMPFTFFGSYPHIFCSVYGFDNSEIGLAFIGILIGTLLAVVTYMIVEKTICLSKDPRAKWETSAGGKAVHCYAGLIRHSSFPVLAWLNGARGCALDCSYYRRGAIWPRNSSTACK
ncbi:hypothetical protein B0O99DRAFT_701389 [Bisporella sp. PMI_857]|nr:hypothetical protein B0O99DRAFT_701389 [Bisporella sp. PMI_857]